MNYSRTSLALVVILTAAVVLGGLLSPVQAQDSLLINYQGLLTNSNGVPLTGSYNLTFKLYSAATGELPLWTETHTALPVSNGRLLANLGSKTLLSPTVLGNTGKYLGITVGNDLELTPRTMLTSVPQAAVSRKIIGDIHTAPGILLLKNDNGDSSLVFNGLDSSPSFRMFTTQTEPPGKAFELRANSGSGPSMSFFNQAGEVMGVEPSPFNTGWSLKGFDPQPEPPGVMFDLSTYFSNPGGPLTDPTVGSTSLRMYGVPDGGANQEMVRLGSSGSQADLRMGFGTPEGGTSRYIGLTSDGAVSRIDVVGPDFGPLPNGHPVTIISDVTNARIGIGTDAPTQALHVEGNICYSGTIGACSDASFKKDIEPIDNALDAVDEMTGVRYSWKTDEYPDRHFSSERQVGVIAQEVKEVVPEAVTLQSDGYYTVDYSRLTPVLLEAIKELKKKNDELTKRLEVLEAERPR